MTNLPRGRLRIVCDLRSECLLGHAVYVALGAFVRFCAALLFSSETGVYRLAFCQKDFLFQ